MKLTFTVAPTLRDPIMERLHAHRLQSNACQTTVTTHHASGFTTVRVYGPTTDVHRCERAVRATLAELERSRKRAARAQT